MSFQELIFGLNDDTKKRHPYLTATTNIDRRKCIRTTPMEILVLSLGRTGTHSMRQALTILGYPTSHGYDMLVNPRDSDMWVEAFNIKYDIPRYKGLNLPRSNEDLTQPAFWDKLLGHVSAVTDMPHNAFGPELIKAYPNAKVILVDRDLETWFPSYERGFIAPQDYVRLIDLVTPFSENIRLMQPIADGVLQGQFGSKDSWEMRRRAKDVYKAHYAEIRACLKDEPDRLLEYRLGSGWEPLCEFLDRPVPKEAFPRTNEAAMNSEMMVAYFTLLARGVIWTLGKWGALIGVVLLLWRYIGLMLSVLP